jgi:hypothetical protein
MTKASVAKGRLRVDGILDSFGVEGATTAIAPKMKASGRKRLCRSDSDVNGAVAIMAELTETQTENEESDDVAALSRTRKKYCRT